MTRSDAHDLLSPPQYYFSVAPRPVHARMWSLANRKLSKSLGGIADSPWAWAALVVGTPLVSLAIALVLAP